LRRPDDHFAAGGTDLSGRFQFTAAVVLVINNSLRKTIHPSNEFAWRARQPCRSRLVVRKETVKEAIRVNGAYLTADPERLEVHTFTHEN
jgi:hypothetical protein